MNNNILNAINNLKDAKEDIINRKSLINKAINEVNLAIDKVGVVEEDFNRNEVPYISTYYIKPIVRPDEEVTIDFYVRDYYGKDIIDEDFTDTFTVRVKVSGRDDIVLSGLKAGDHSVSLGSFPNLNNEEQKFSIIATDQYGRNSHELFNFFLVREDMTDINEYVMTEADLVAYNITINDNYENVIWVDVPSSGMNTTAINNAVSTAIAQNPPVSKTYNSFRVSLDGKQRRNSLWGYNKVVYANDYNKDEVLAESKATREGLQQLLNDKAAEGYNKIKLLNGVYRIDHEKSIFLPSNLTVDMNQATLKQNPFTGANGLMITLNNVFDTHLINGILEGDYYTHDYANSTNNSEWVIGIEMGSEAKYCSFENLVVKDITGYGGGNGISSTVVPYTYFWYADIGTFIDGDVDRETGEFIESSDRVISSKTFDIQSYAELGYITIGKYLGYQGNGCDTWNIIVHFYDKDNNYIKSIDGYQYRRIGVPSNAKFMRVSLIGTTKPTSLSYYQFRVPTHCAFKNVTFENCRAVGLAQSNMNDMLVEDCEFINCGQTAANCAYDAEDGWDMMQDVTFRRLNFHDNPLNEFLTCAGHNFVVEDMIQGDVYIWGRTKDFVLRNSNCGAVSIGDDKLSQHGIYRIYDSKVQGGSLNGNVGRRLVAEDRLNGFAIYDSILSRFSSASYCKNCTINIKNTGDINYVSNLSMDNCIIRPAGDSKGYEMAINDTRREGTIKINNCKFYGGVSFSNHNAFYSGEFNNCYFEDIKVSPSVKINENEEVVFNNCELNTTHADLLSFGGFTYDVGTIRVTFNNCIIRSNVTKDLIQAYAKASHGYVKFIDCTIDFTAPEVYIFNYSYNEHLFEDLKIYFINSKFTKEIPFCRDKHKSVLENKVTLIIE